MTLQQRLTYVELDINYCSLTYGVSPCTASIPTTGAAKCFNTKATCQDVANIDLEPVTLRFAKAVDYRPVGIEALPNIVSVDFTPSMLDPGESLGSRATLRVTFREHPHSDTGPGYDKYHAERSYNPWDQGAHWAKFRARQPYLRGEPIRWIEGYVGQDLADMETRHFVVESFNGPTPEGIYTLIAKDPLRLADGDRAVAPMPNNGYLSGALDSSVTAATLAPSGIGNLEYAASGYLNLGGKEIVAFTRSGDSLTITRGQLGTTAVAHDAEERCQLALRYSSQDPADLIYGWLTTYTPNFDADWIALPAWQEETDNFLGRNYTGTIAEPTSVNQLIGEVMQQAGLSVWWDDVNEQVRLQVLRQIGTEAALFDENLMLKNSFGLKEQPEKRVSQCWTAFAQNNPLKGLEEKDNYRSFQVDVDTDNEENYGDSAFKKIWARWIPLGGRTAAERCNQLQLGRYTTPPRLFTFSLFRGAQDAPVLGGGYRLKHRVIQDATGAEEDVPVQLISVKPTATHFECTALEMRYTAQASDDLTNHAITIDVSTYNVNLKTLHNSLYEDAAAGDVVNLVISSGIVIGSLNTSLPALDVGYAPGELPTSVSTAGDRTSGSPLITGLADTSGYVAGMAATGDGIPSRARILSVDSGSQITLDANATSTGSFSVGSPLTVHLVRIRIRVRQRIQGKGGAGGYGLVNYGGGAHLDAAPGTAGGDALKTLVPIDLLLDEDAGQVWGGGGGGGGDQTRIDTGHNGGGGGGGAGIPPGAGGYGHDLADDGDAGSDTLGGNGGRSYTSSGFFEAPGYQTGLRGGAGGAAGQPGSTPSGTGGTGGAGGAPGNSIDGDSLVKRTGTGDVRGPTVN